jgi:hypothetical protein
MTSYPNRENSRVACGGTPRWLRWAPRDSRQHPCPCVGLNLSSVRLGPKPRRLAVSEIATSRSAGHRSAYWMPVGRGAAGRPDDTRFAADEKTPVAFEKSSQQGLNRADSRSRAATCADGAAAVAGGPHESRVGRPCAPQGSHILGNLVSRRERAEYLFQVGLKCAPTGRVDA